LTGEAGFSADYWDVLRSFTIDLMKLSPVNSAIAPQAAGGYSQAIEVTGAQRILYVSGQVPETLDGEVPKAFVEQARVVWNNVIAQLASANMAVENLTKVTIFLSSREFAVLNREIRQEFLGGHRPALTVIVAGIFDEKWLLEIEAIAAA
jgi:2-iminobutanoate/2-iminopropanoate deaminase